MKKGVIRGHLHAGLMSLLLFSGGCGSGSNFNRIWGSESSADIKMIDAKSAYDSGDFATAIKYASQVLEANPDHEEAAIVLGYAYVSQSGLDPYRVASCLVNLSSTNKSSSSSSGNRCSSSSSASGLVSIDDSIETLFNMADTPSTSGSSSNSDSSTLKTLQYGLLTLNDEDFAKLKKSDFKGTSGLFEGNTSLVIPALVTDELRDSVNILRNLNNVVKSVCRFVDDSSAIKTETTRYQSIGCDLTTYTRRNSAKAHFLWAISHLGEALTFTSVILYNSGENSSYNFQRASAAVAAQTNTSIDKIVSQIEEIQLAVATIFDTEDSNSMISKTLYDLNATSGSFDAIAGLPDSVKQQISKILDGVKSVGKSIGGAGSETKALKSRLLEAVTNSVISKTNETIISVVKNAGGPSDPNAITPDVVDKLPDTQKSQVDKLCTSYDSLTKDSPSDKRKSGKPKACR